MSETYKTQAEAVSAALDAVAKEHGLELFITSGYEGHSLIVAAILAHLAKVQPAAPETKRQMYVLSDPAPQPAAPVEVSEAMVGAAMYAYDIHRDDNQCPHPAMRAALIAALECQRGGA